MFKKYKKEELEYLIFNEELSYAAIGRKFGVTGNAIRKYAKKIGIILPHKRMINEKEKFNKGKTILDKITDSEFKDIIKSSVGWEEISNKIGYKMCNSETKEKIIKRCETLNLFLNVFRQNIVSKMSKGYLLFNRKNWQSANSAIRKEARRIYFYYNNKNPKCAICGYNKHIDVAHIKSVSSFPKDTPLSIINDINNLIGLYPNHHWEYDNGLLDLKTNT